ncbi:hypothetical protein BBG47_13925 [Paenibacillus sp. KS1]|nr:hypothetical protein BBG47_13925 [Paenibacillus sp. KS1]
MLYSRSMLLASPQVLEDVIHPSIIKVLPAVEPLSAYVDTNYLFLSSNHHFHLHVKSEYKEHCKDVAR